MSLVYDRMTNTDHRNFLLLFRLHFTFYTLSFFHETDSIALQTAPKIVRSTCNSNGKFRFESTLVNMY